MTWLRMTVKRLALLLFRLTGALMWARHRLGGEGAVIVLTFHRVLTDEQARRTKSLPALVMRQRTFEQLAEYLAEHAVVLQPEEARPLRHVGRSPAVVLTFDDGWEDNGTVAHPIARRWGLPFVIFICPGLMDSVEPFWPERAIAAAGIAPETASSLIEELKQLPPQDRARRIHALGPTEGKQARDVDRTMSWHDVRRLLEEGVTFGSHSFQHEILTYLDEAALRLDLERARGDIVRQTRRDCSLFAYPNGSTSETVATAVAQAGHALAYSTREGGWFDGTDRFQVPRINMWDGRFVWFGRFSPTLFQYHAYWRPFIAWVMEAETLSARIARFLGIHRRTASTALRVLSLGLYYP